MSFSFLVMEQDVSLVSKGALPSRTHEIKTQRRAFPPSQPLLPHSLPVGVVLGKAGAGASRGAPLASLLSQGV